MKIKEIERMVANLEDKIKGRRTDVQNFDLTCCRGIYMRTDSAFSVFCTYISLMTEKQLYFSITMTFSNRRRCIYIILVSRELRTSDVINKQNPHDHQNIFPSSLLVPTSYRSLKKSFVFFVKYQLLEVKIETIIYNLLPKFEIFFDDTYCR